MNAFPSLRLFGYTPSVGSHICTVCNLSILIIFDFEFSGGAYAGAVERKLGHVAEGFVGDLVLVDPDIVTQPELLHNLLPDAVLVGGVLSAANNLLRGNRDGCATDENGSTAPVLLKGVGPVLWAVTDRAGASVSLSEATFLPGRNGRPSNNRRNNQPVPPPFCVSEYCVPSDGMVTSGLRCACILRGKYCSEV